MNGSPRRIGSDVVPNALVTVGSVALVSAYVPSAFTTPISTFSDAGIFYSVFRQLAQERRLYVDILDRKGPLFFCFCSVVLLRHRFRRTHDYGKVTEHPNYCTNDFENFESPPQYVSKNSFDIHLLPCDLTPA
jgi:hypothetical protein